VGSLEQVEAVLPHQRPDPADVGNVVQALTEHRVAHRLAGAVGHRADEGGDRGQGRRLALPPADVPPGRDPDQQQILAAVADVEDLGHRAGEEIDRLDLHRFLRG